MMMDNWARVRSYLEEASDSELCTIAEFHAKMVELGEDSHCYSETCLKRKLIEHYKDHSMRSNLKDLTLLTFKI